MTGPTHPHSLRVRSFIDCDDPEAYGLEDLLHDVRALNSDPETLPFSFSCDNDILVWALALLCESPLARTFAFDARFEDWSIELDEIEDGHHIVDPQLRILIMPRFVPSAAAFGRSPYFRAMFLCELCRGLRAIWHQDTGVRHGHELNLTSQILWNRLKSADYDLLTLAIAWEVREAGFPEFWRHVIGSDLGDLAVAYAAILERHPAGIAMNSILRKLFLQWMEMDHNLTPVDHRTLERVDHYLGNPGTGRPFGTDKLSSSDVMKLTTLPKDAPYLEALASHVLNEPFFARMPDPINEAHLQHVLEDLSAQKITRAEFRDKELAQKFFPDFFMGAVDTVA